MGCSKFTVITGLPEFTVRPVVRGRTEGMDQVEFPVVTPTCYMLSQIYKKNGVVLFHDPKKGKELRE